MTTRQSNKLNAKRHHWSLSVFIHVHTSFLTTLLTVHAAGYEAIPISFATDRFRVSIFPISIHQRCSEHVVCSLSPRCATNTMISIGYTFHVEIKKRNRISTSSVQLQTKCFVPSGLPPLLVCLDAHDSLSGRFNGKRRVPKAIDANRC